MKCHLLSIGKGSDKLEAALDEAQRTLSDAGFDVSAEIRDGEPDKVIGEAVAEDHIDLLVMGAYGHSHIRHLIVGSTTTAMIRTVQDSRYCCSARNRCFAPSYEHCKYSHSAIYQLVKLPASSR